MKKVIIRTAVSVLAAFLCISIHAQNSATAQTTIVAWDGMVTAGYVNKGGYVNFGGPSVRFGKKPWSIVFGMLPTLRIKEDKVPKGAVKNSMVTPTAGFGVTLVYKHLVLQLPFYYNPKTATVNGKWNPGIGIGYKL